MKCLDGQSGLPPGLRLHRWQHKGRKAAGSEEGAGFSWEAAGLAVHIQGVTRLFQRSQTHGTGRPADPGTQSPARDVAVMWTLQAWEDTPQFKKLKQPSGTESSNPNEIICIFIYLLPAFVHLFPSLK